VVPANGRVWQSLNSIGVVASANRALDPRALESEAAEAGGAGGCAAQFRDAFERLVTALVGEACLTTTGARAAGDSLVSALITQARLLRLLQRRQELADRSIPGPLVITGLHRTGTTLVQDLLAEHPAIRAPRLWELLSPADNRSAEAFLVAKARSYVEEYYRAAPAFRAIHSLGAQQPDECHRLKSPTFLSEIYWLRYRIPSYAAWLSGQDHLPAYEFHRAALSAILSRRPTDHGAVPSAVVVKCPFHMRHLSQLAATYPHARVVRMHRDPLVALASWCSLTATIRQARASHVDRREIGSQLLEHASAVVDDDRDDGGGAMPTLDVRYQDLIRAPLAVASTICEFAGMPFPDPARERMRRFLADRPQQRLGRHAYRLEDYGLRASRLAQRFAAYRRRYGV
jgi:ribosomal protein L17